MTDEEEQAARESRADVGMAEQLAFIIGLLRAILAELRRIGGPHE